jgi:arsenite-transporting ATPase
MVISEARRTYTYLGLFGYAVDAAVVNRVLPDTVVDPYFDRWHEIQKGHLESVYDGFADVDIRELRLFDEEMVGIERLRLVGEELYAGRDPVDHFSEGRPFRVEDEGDNVILVLSVPFVLKRRQVRRAQLVDAELRVTFGLDE